MSKQAPKQSKLWLVPATLALALTWASSASAKQEYYDAIFDATGTCADCRLCHTTAVGNSASWDPSNLFLQELTIKGRKGDAPDPTSDADLDGYSDVDELSNFGDPSDPTVGPGEFECPGAEYGCVRVAKQKPESDAWLMLSSLLVVIGLVRRRRR